ncbi:MAG TPA: serine/threonine-protein kinase [Kofleriaceae bacterium]|nr:serine/threonine-protein kinase [Kofleriaceae bacterium]
MNLIGEGGMGRVYAAEHVGIGKKVALKILHAVFSNTAEAVERFRAEARMTSKIANAHIVDVTDSGTTADGRLYFVMERLEGIELGEAMRDGTLSLERSLRIARQIAEAVAAAHAQGVIHRDLKPENILLIDREGDRDFVKVLDFGIALTVGGEGPKRRLTQPGLAVGTPEYMAPEQAMEATADERSDIYAVGAMLYEMATGTPAYSGDTFTKVLVEKAQHDPPPPRQLRGDLPPDIEAVIVRAMARKPAERHQTMQELIADLAACLDALLAPVISGSGLLEVSSPSLATVKPITAAGLLLDPVDPTAATMAMTVDQGQVQAQPRTRKRDIIPLALVLVLVLGGAVALYILVLRPTTKATESTPAPASAAPTTAKVAPSPSTKPLTAPRPVGSKPVAKPEVKDTPKDDVAPPDKPAPPPKTAKQARAYLAKAAAAQKKKQWDAARELYDRVSRGRHDPERGHLGLAQVALATGDPRTAVKHAKTSVRMGGGSPARKVLAQANAKLKKKR